MSKFVLLEHDTTQPTCPPPPGREVHWDLLIAADDTERVPTWRLLRDPRAAVGEIPAERIADHRRHYLTYEGPVSGDRGYVRRVDAGGLRAEQIAEDRLAAEFDGEHLRGHYEIVHSRGGRLVFRRSYASA